MAPKKVNLQWINKDSTRQAMLKKRKASSMKKGSDMTTLCGIKASVIVYGQGKSQPEVWLSVLEARQLLNHFKAMPNYLFFRKENILINIPAFASTNACCCPLLQATLQCLKKTKKW
jgi:hypothetical protein